MERVLNIFWSEARNGEGNHELLILYSDNTYDRMDIYIPEPYNKDGVYYRGFFNLRKMRQKKLNKQDARIYVSDMAEKFRETC